MKTIKEFTERVYPVVLKEVAKRGLDPSVATNIMKQFALESGYGSKRTGTNNISGTKWYKTMGDRGYTINPKDNIKYADFKDLEDQVSFHIANIENIWGDDVFQKHDIDEYIEAIHSNGRSYSGKTPEEYAGIMKNTLSLDKEMKAYLDKGVDHIYTRSNMENPSSSQLYAKDEIKLEDPEEFENLMEYLLSSERNRSSSFSNDEEDDEDEDDFMDSIDEEDEDGDTYEDSKNNSNDIFNNIYNIIEQNREERERNVENSINTFRKYSQSLSADDYFRDGGQFEEDYAEVEKDKYLLEALNEEERREYMSILKDKKLYKQGYEKGL